MNEYTDITKIEKRMDKLEQSIDEIKNLINGRNAYDDCSSYDRQSYVYRQLINDVLSNFDYGVVHNVMTMLGWKWVGTKDGVPSINEIKSEARDILIRAVDENTTIETGGLKAEFEKPKNEGEEPFIRLSFIVEDSCNY